MHFSILKGFSFFGLWFSQFKDSHVHDSAVMKGLHHISLLPIPPEAGHRETKAPLCRKAELLCIGDLDQHWYSEREFR